MLARFGPALLFAPLALVGCFHGSKASLVEPEPLPSSNGVVPPVDRDAEMCARARACESQLEIATEDERPDELDRCRARLADASARAAILYAYADPRWSPPYPAVCVDPKSPEPPPPAEAEPTPASASVRQGCGAVFAFAIDRAGHSPIHIHSRTPQCRSSIADLVEAPNVRRAGAEAWRRRVCPGARCGPREGTLIIVDPVGATAPGCFDLWSYHATGGGHERVCVDVDRIRTTQVGVVY